MRIDFTVLDPTRVDHAPTGGPAMSHPMGRWRRMEAPVVRIFQPVDCHDPERNAGSPGLKRTPDGDSRHSVPKKWMGQAEPTGLPALFCFDAI